MFISAIVFHLHVNTTITQSKTHIPERISEIHTSNSTAFRSHVHDISNTLNTDLFWKKYSYVFASYMAQAFKIPRE